MCAYLCDVYRLFYVSWIEELVEDLDELFCSKLYHANAAGHESLLDDRHALVELRAVFLEVAKLLFRRRPLLMLRGEQPLQRVRADDGRAVRHHDEEGLRHDVRRVGERLDEIDVFLGLDLHEVDRLLALSVLEESDIRPDIKPSGLYEDLHGEVERVQEVLELEDDGLLLVA